MAEDTELDFMAWAEQSSLSIGSDDPWEKLAEYIRSGNLIPVISNSLRDDRFMHMMKMPDKEMSALISGLLAVAIKYPLADKDNLAMVTQYHQVTADSRDEAKREYLDFLTSFIIRWAKQTDPRAKALIEDENLDHAPDLSFSDILVKLGYPIYPEGKQDPLRVLAKLDLPIYITTSYYEHLEQALIAEGKHPRSQVCGWAGRSSLIKENHWASSRPIDDLAQAIKEPLVFHLFGMERYPHTMVLSLDDHLSFLVNIFTRDGQAKTSQDVGAPSPIPSYLWEKISDLPLLLLGYKLHDWDFQVLYRGLITAKPTARGRDAGLVLQLEPDVKRGVTNPEAVCKYMQKYFTRDVKFRVEFGKPDAVVAKLYEVYQQHS